jgi:putative endonuclease
MRATIALGAFGEQLAADYLQSQGMAILDRNWRCASGEIDIVARDGADLVICEVKTRRSTAFGDPAEAVTARKLRRLRELALRWLEAQGLHVRGIRIDVVTIVQARGCRPVLTHLRGVE